MEVDRHISTLTVALLLEEPLFGHLLSALVKEPAAAPGLALGWRRELPVLRVGPLTGQASGARGFGAVRHELLHLLFRHVLPPPGLSLPWLYHLAADLVVNQYIPPEELPADALTLERFAPLDLPPGRDARFYYQALLTAWREAPAGGEAPPSWRLLLDRCLRGDHPAIRRHAGWRDASFPDLTGQRERAPQLERLLRQVCLAMPAAALDRLAPALRACLAPPPAPSASIDWRRRLRLFAAGSRRSRLRHTIRRPSPRYGTTPGLRLERRGRLLVAVDTSASVPPALLETFFAEVHALWGLGHDIEVVECDVAIRRRYLYAGRPPQVALGRGGTRFDAPLAWAAARERPDAIVYFTDGQGPPLQMPPPCPLLWVVGNPAGELRLVRGMHPLIN